MADPAKDSWWHVADLSTPIILAILAILGGFLRWTFKAFFAQWTTVLDARYARRPDFVLLQKQMAIVQKQLRALRHPHDHEDGD